MSFLSIDFWQSLIHIRTLLCREYSNERCSLAYCWRGRVSVNFLLVYLSFVNQASSTLSIYDRRGRWHQMTLIPIEDRLCQLSNFVAMGSGVDLSSFLKDLWISPFHWRGIRNLQDIELVWQSSQKTMNKTVKVPKQRLQVVWSKNLIRDKECKRWSNRFRYNYLQNWWSTNFQYQRYSPRIC